MAVLEVLDQGLQLMTHCLMTRLPAALDGMCLVMSKTLNDQANVASF